MSSGPQVSPRAAGGSAPHDTSHHPGGFVWLKPGTKSPVAAYFEGRERVLGRHRCHQCGGWCR